MKSSGTTEFWKLYRELPERIRQATKRTCRLWKENPRASALCFKKRFIRFGLERPVIAQSRRMCFSTIGLLKEYSFCMSRDLATIAEEALKLPQNEQLKLARTLLEKNEASGDQETDAAWEQEIERRIQLIDAGLAKGRPFSDVLRDIDRQLGK